MVNHERSRDLLILFRYLFYCRGELVPCPAFLGCGRIGNSRRIKGRLIDDHTYCRIIYICTVKLAVPDAASVEVVRIKGGVVQRKYVIDIRIEV